jgi:hypothetical protein
MLYSLLSRSQVRIMAPATSPTSPCMNPSPSRVTPSREGRRAGYAKAWKKVGKVPK